MRQTLSGRLKTSSWKGRRRRRARRSSLLECVPFPPPPALSTDAVVCRHRTSSSCTSTARRTTATRAPSRTRVTSSFPNTSTSLPSATVAHPLLPLSTPPHLPRLRLETSTASPPSLSTTDPPTSVTTSPTVAVRSLQTRTPLSPPTSRCGTVSRTRRSSLRPSTKRSERTLSSSSTSECREREVTQRRRRRRDWRGSRRWSTARRLVSLRAGELAPAERRRTSTSRRWSREARIVHRPFPQLVLALPRERSIVE